MNIICIEMEHLEGGQVCRESEKGICLKLEVVLG